MDDRFFNAFLPPSARVAGRTLSRFTLWHQFLLSAIDSPIATGAKRFGIPDLLAAVKICRSTYARRPNMRPSLIDVFWTWHFTRNPKAFRRHAETLFQWIAAQCSPPKYWKEQSAAGSTSKSYVVDKGPKILGVFVSLMTRAGMTRAEAWDTPTGEARWIDAMIAKNEGVPIHFLDDEDLDDSPISFDTMTEEEALEQFRRELPESIAMQTFERWKKERKAGNA